MQTATALALTKDVTDLVERIAAQIQPGQIILFRAPPSGTAGPESDVDLLVVTETNGRPPRRAAEIYRTISHHIPIDILVGSPEYVRDPSRRDLILTEILKHGVTVHETGDLAPLIDRSA